MVRVKTITALYTCMLNPVTEPLIEKVLPALRKVVAEKLYDRGYTQNEIAELLEITQPAVSQYLHSQRGYLSKEIKSDEDLDNLASEITTLVTTDGSKNDMESTYKEFCEVFIGKEDFYSLVGSDKDFFYDI